MARRFLDVLRDLFRRRAPGRASGYPGDFVGMPTIEFAPKPDGRPDPGEIVWTWVPFEEDVRQGKDRPVLLIGRDGRWLLACPLSSQDHNADAAQEHRAGREWVEIGAGPWDKQGRRSFVRVDRIIRVSESAIRREGSFLQEARFERVADGIRRHHA